MRTYYRGPDAFVTADEFIWLVDTPKIVSVRELHETQRIVQAARARSADGLVVSAAGLAVFAAAGWLAAGPLAGALLAALAVAVLVVAVCTRQSSKARTYRVVATVRGARTTIYESRDLRVFNQVARALGRSLENRRHTRDAYGLVAVP